MSSSAGAAAPAAVPPASSPGTQASSRSLGVGRKESFDSQLSQPPRLRTKTQEEHMFPKQACDCCYFKTCGGIQCSPIRLVVISIYAVCFAGLVVSSLILRNTVWHDKLHDVGWFIAFVFVVLTLPLSAYDVGRHLLHYRDPELQKYVVRIIYMVPIYSIESWLALVFKDGTVVFQTMRECYEAYVIYCLYRLLLCSIARTDEARLAIIEGKTAKELHHMRPFCHLKTWQGREFMQRTKQGTLQYVVIKLICTCVTIMTVSTPVEPLDGPVSLSPAPAPGAAPPAVSPSSSGEIIPCPDNQVSDLFGEGEFRMDRAYIYVAVATNCSQVWAMYCLVLFYHAFATEMSHIRPLAKLLVVKAVVFFSFWQGVGIAMMTSLGWIGATSNPSAVSPCYTAEDVAAGLQNFIICIEMFVAAIAHHLFFSASEFNAGGEAQTPFLSAFVESALPVDVAKDFGEAFVPTNLPSIPDPRSIVGGRKSDPKEPEQAGDAL